MVLLMYRLITLRLRLSCLRNLQCQEKSMDSFRKAGQLGMETQMGTKTDIMPV